MRRAEKPGALFLLAILTSGAGLRSKQARRRNGLLDDRDGGVAGAAVGYQDIAAGVGERGGELYG